jgi:hypothetical protein
MAGFVTDRSEGALPLQAAELRFRNGLAARTDLHAQCATGFAANLNIVQNPHWLR